MTFDLASARERARMHADHADVLENTACVLLSSKGPDREALDHARDLLNRAHTRRRVGLELQAMCDHVAAGRASVS